MSAARARAGAMPASASSGVRSVFIFLEKSLQHPHSKRGQL
jgi:hypothetical protein